MTHDTHCMILLQQIAAMNCRTDRDEWIMNDTMMLNDAVYALRNNGTDFASEFLVICDESRSRIVAARFRRVTYFVKLVFQ